MAKVTAEKVHTSGIALGGIGSGSVELLPDGEFHYWQIANPPRFAKISNDSKVDDGEGSLGALSFWVRNKKKNSNVVVRRLGMHTVAEEFTYRMFAWNKPVERIDFDGKFPVCDLEYNDSALDCKLSLKAVSPFVPHDSDISSTPGFYLDFTVENPCNEEIEVSLVGALEPSFANKKEGNINSLHEVGGGIGIHIAPEKKSGSECCGDVCFSIDGDGAKSYITGEYFRFMKEYVGNSSFGVTQESFLFGFRENGCLPDSKHGCGVKHMLKKVMGNEGIDVLYDEISGYPFAASILERLRHINPHFPENRSEKLSYLKACFRNILRMGSDFGSCALCSKVVLAPGEKKNIRFVLTWFFSNLYSEQGKKIGHYYENLYKSSLEANKFLVENYNEVHERAVEFSELMYDTELPSIYPDCWSSNLSPLIKSSHYIKNGKFGLWEGLGSCGFHTTDITYHASFGLVNLFPDLQKKQMLMGAEFQLKDGRVHHLFKPGFEKVDNSYDRVDMNMQFVLMVLRDYYFTGDRCYLVSMWDNVKRAMDYIEKIDTDGDGLPDYNTKRNTYDAWNFSGASAYISVLWLAALKAAAVMADKVNDKERYSRWNEILERGNKSLEEKLWNGEYYNLWIDCDSKDESLMTDQLDGEWFLRMAGLEGNISDERIRQVIECIFRNNFDKDQGLVNATVPENKKTTVHTYKNCQAGASWTGIGYAFSALALSVGCTDVSDKIVQSIHSNQYRLGHFWDHWECGHHYTRPMSSWTTLIALSGMKVDYEKKKLSFCPVCDNLTLPIVLSDVIGKIKFFDGNYDLYCISGDLSGWDISVNFKK